MEKNELNESLNRFRELLKYDVKNGKSSLDERRMHSYTDDTDYADEEETEEEGTEGGEEGGDNPDFDFGGGEETEGGEEEGGFGEEPEGGEEETEEEGGEEDEFGTADEFSAADEIEDEESDVEEIDVTDIVKRADDAKSYSEKAVKAAEEGKGMIQDLMSKFDSLQQSLSKIDSVANEINVIKSDLQSQKPKEKLELRSLDSYPFNVKLTDYWNDEKLKDNYEITSGAPDAESKDGQVKVWKVSPEDAKEYNPGDIKKSFVPESKSKKKVLTESQTFCGECGTKLQSGERFCGECGSKVETNEKQNNGNQFNIEGVLSKNGYKLKIQSPVKFLDGTTIELSIRDKCNDCSLPIGKKVEIRGTTKNGEKPGFNNPIIVKSPKDILVK